MPATQPVLDVTLEPKQEIAKREPSEGDAFVAMVERLAANPQVDPEKLSKILDLQERILDRNAKAAFEGAYARMQAKLPEVGERGQILVKGVLRSTYAKLEDIHAAVKPILHDFGFAIRHRTEWPDNKPGVIRIVGILSHEDGHSEESVFEAPMDRSEYRTDIQSMGSTVSYGRRYTTLDLLNIATRGQDDDGERSAAPAAPDGYDEWIVDMEALTDEGFAKLSAAWNKAKPEFRSYVAKHEPRKWEGLKARAQKVAKK